MDESDVQTTKKSNKDNSSESEEIITDEQSESSEEEEDTININRNLIPSVPLSSNFTGSALDNLSRLGVSAYNAEDVDVYSLFDSNL